MSKHFGNVPPCASRKKVPFSGWLRRAFPAVSAGAPRTDWCPPKPPIRRRGWRRAGGTTTGRTTGWAGRGTRASRLARARHFSAWPRYTNSTRPSREVRTITLRRTRFAPRAAGPVDPTAPHTPPSSPLAPLAPSLNRTGRLEYSRTGCPGGQSAAQRAAGEELSRWHWVYGGTCFRLSQRVRSARGRPIIVSRGYAMTRGGVDALKEQLWAEAIRRGLGRAVEVLVVADGAVWIWNLADDRFAGARQRLDFYHVSQHLWAVAHTLHPDDAVAARAWVEPMLAKLKADASCEVITELEQLRQRVEGAAREKVERERAYLETHRDRLDYGTAKQRGEPLGSGAMESTCRQYQVRFKRTGQFWSQTGAEALLSLETFRRNGRWAVLFPTPSQLTPVETDLRPEFQQPRNKL